MLKYKKGTCTNKINLFGSVSVAQCQNLDIKIQFLLASKRIYRIVTKLKRKIYYHTATVSLAFSQVKLVQKQSQPSKFK